MKRKGRSYAKSSCCQGPETEKAFFRRRFLYRIVVRCAIASGIGKRHRAAFAKRNCFNKVGKYARKGGIWRRGPSWQLSDRKTGEKGKAASGAWYGTDPYGLGLLSLHSRKGRRGSVRYDLLDHRLHKLTWRISGFKRAKIRLPVNELCA